MPYADTAAVTVTTAWTSLGVSPLSFVNAADLSMQVFRQASGVPAATVVGAALEAGQKYVNEGAEEIVYARLMPDQRTASPTRTIFVERSVLQAGVPAVPNTAFILDSLASTNGALIATGSSGLHAFYASNIGATIAFVKLHNKATAPTVGTDIPAMIISVPAAVAGVPGIATLPIGAVGFRFPLGLGIATTGLVTDADTTAVAAGQVKVILSRTV